MCNLPLQSPTSISHFNLPCNLACNLRPHLLAPPRLITPSQIWTAPRLFTGFVKCCGGTLPDSLPVLLALPTQPLQDAIAQEPELREPLFSYAATHLAEVPQEAKEALGLADDEAEEL